MLLQLNPPIPLVTPKGKGFAHLVVDYGQEHDLIWTVFIDETGECWSFRNQEGPGESGQCNPSGCCRLFEWWGD